MTLHKQTLEKVIKHVQAMLTREEQKRTAAYDEDDLQLQALNSVVANENVKLLASLIKSLEKLL